MQPETRRKAIIRNGVVSGSVWEKRIKMDEVKGGMKVFNATGESHNDEEGVQVYRRLRKNQSDGAEAEKRKRKVWIQADPQGIPISLKKELSIEIGCNSGVNDKGLLHINVDDCNDKEIKEGGVNGIDMEEEKKGFDDKEMDLSAEKEKSMEDARNTEEINEIQIASPPRASVDKKSDSVEFSPGGNEWEISGTSSKMQHIFDLVMWRDIAKSAFAFGFGTFLLVSSSYTKDFELSLVTVISYMGLLYLAAIFVMRSIFRRGIEEVEFLNKSDEGYMVGEEEAIWFLRRILPYINELLLRTRALFSGDPATTMKMALLLFVMARCGNSITIWTLAKIAFFGVFTVPKVLSSYSVQLARFGQFYLSSFRDGWESCKYKKAILLAIFTLIWNLSSTMARIWAVFMLIVAVRLYQQCMIATWDEDAISSIEQHHHSHQQQQHID